MVQLNIFIENIYYIYLVNSFYPQDYEFIINARIFDVSFNIMKPFDFLDNLNNIIYHSVDTFYIAKENVMNDFSKILNIK